MSPILFKGSYCIPGSPLEFNSEGEEIEQKEHKEQLMQILISLGPDSSTSNAYQGEQRRLFETTLLASRAYKAKTLQSKLKGAPADIVDFIK